VNIPNSPVQLIIFIVVVLVLVWAFLQIVPTLVAPFT
jgi:hypothetical protein